MIKFLPIKETTYKVTSRLLTVLFNRLSYKNEQNEQNEQNELLNNFFSKDFNIEFKNITKYHLYDLHSKLKINVKN